YRDERDRANAHLYRSLVTEAQSHLTAHDSEWHAHATDALSEAAALDVPTRDVAALRDLVLSCQASYFPSFRRLERWDAHGGTPSALAASPRGTLTAAVTD